MYAVGIDISKEKSTVAVISKEGKMLLKPFEIDHNNKGISLLLEKVKEYPKEKIRFLMEATSHYHYQMLQALIDEKYWVCVENALTIKKYCDTDIRKVKNDKKYSIKIANYLVEKWYRLKKYEPQEDIRKELLFLSREYNKSINIRAKLKIQLGELIDKTFPGIKKIVNAETRCELLLNIYEKYWNPKLVLEKNQKEFVKDIDNIAKKLGHKVGITIGIKIYELAPTVITSRPNNYITQLAITNCIQLLRQAIEASNNIITEMNKLSSSLKEYKVVREMKGVGEKTCSRLIAEIGDVRRFKNANSLIAFCGIDTPSYQSGSFTATQRHITKRGNKNLRKVGYEIMKNLKSSRPKQDNAVYEYIVKKELEGKNKAVAKIAGLNKFLRIYYARVKEVYN